MNKCKKKCIKYKKALLLILEYLIIANNVSLMTFAEICFTESEVKLLKEVLEELLNEKK